MSVLSLSLASPGERLPRGIPAHRRWVESGLALDTRSGPGGRARPGHCTSFSPLGYFLDGFVESNGASKNVDSTQVDMDSGRSLG